MTPIWYNYFALSSRNDLRFAEKESPGTKEQNARENEQGVSFEHSTTENIPLTALCAAVRLKSCPPLRKATEDLAYSYRLCRLLRKWRPVVRNLGAGR